MPSVVIINSGPTCHATTRLLEPKDCLLILTRVSLLIGDHAKEEFIAKWEESYGRLCLSRGPWTGYAVIVELGPVSNGDGNNISQGFIM